MFDKYLFPSRHIFSLPDFYLPDMFHNFLSFFSLSEADNSLLTTRCIMHTNDLTGIKHTREGGKKQIDLAL